MNGGTNRDPVRCYIGLGSNLDRPRDQVLSAMEELHAAACCSVVRRSSLYVSTPIGDSQQPDFINAVCAMRCRVQARALLELMQAIERRHGRERSSERRHGPRSLDLDLLMYGDAEIDEPGLIVPHPRMHQRRFVLLPLSEIAPRLHVPGRGVVYRLLERDEIRRQHVAMSPA